MCVSMCVCVYVHRFAAGEASTEEIKERQARSLADPEIQNILKDPVMQQVLKDFQVRAVCLCVCVYLCGVVQPGVLLSRRHQSAAGRQQLNQHGSQRARSQWGMSYELATFPACNRDHCWHLMWPLLLSCVFYVQENPKAAQVHLKQPEIMAKINKLVAAGIIQVK